MKKFKVTIKGISPLLQARHPSPEEEEKITGLSQGNKKRRKLSDKEQYEMHAFKLKGKYYQPSEQIEAAMTKASVNFKMDGKKTFKDVIKGGIFVDPPQIIHKKKKFIMDACWGRNPSTGGAIWVVRPRIDEWELELNINLLQDERISSEQLKEILVYAGLYVGIGAWRPKFGRFEVIKFEEVDK